MIDLDALERCYANHDVHLFNSEMQRSFPALVAHIKDLEAQLAEAEEDARRWQYARTLADGKHRDGDSWIEIILPWPHGTHHRTSDCADASVDAALTEQWQVCGEANESEGS